MTTMNAITHGGISLPFPFVSSHVPPRHAPSTQSHLSEQKPPIMPAEAPYMPAYSRSKPFFGTGLFRSDAKTATNLLSR